VSTSPQPGLWHQATSSRGGRWATGVAIGAVVTRAAATGVPEVILVQLGAVTAATDTSVAVRSDDGYVDSYVVSTTTTLRGPARAAGLAVGTRVTVVAQKEGRAALLVATAGRSS